MQVDAESGLVIPDGQDLRSISLRRPTLTEVALEPCCQGSGQTGICVGSGGLSRHLSKVQNCNQKFVPVVCNLKSTKRGTKKAQKRARAVQEQSRKPCPAHIRPATRIARERPLNNISIKFSTCCIHYDTSLQRFLFRVPDKLAGL